MMYDPLKRAITYLRISVTDRCNLRCTYCMPEEGIPLVDHSEILTFNEIEEFTRVAVSNGVNKVRITGGEPLVRKGITELVRRLASIEGITDLSMTTNGQLLSQFAEELEKAGLIRINISLDTADPDRYREITRGGDINKVFDGIEAAKSAGLLPIKLNCVVNSDRNEPDAQSVLKFAQERALSGINGIEVRFIKMMDLHTGSFGIVDGGDGGDCPRCNRVRLTANGLVKPCLFSDLGYSIREYGAEKALEMAVKNKPAKGSHNDTGKFYNIGG